MGVRGEVNSLPQPRNGVFQVFELAEALETSEEGAAKVVKTVGFVGVTVRSEVNSSSLPRNGVFQVVELAEALEASEEGAAEVVKTAGLVTLLKT